MDVNKMKNIIDLGSDFFGVIELSNRNEVLLHIAKGYAKREDKIKNNVETRFASTSGTNIEIIA